VMTSLMTSSNYIVMFKREERTIVSSQQQTGYLVTYMAVVWLTASVTDTIGFPASALLLPGGFGPTQHTLSNAHDNSTVWLSSDAPPPPKTRANAWRLVWLRDTVPGPSTSAYVHETEYLNEVYTCGMLHACTCAHV
jgi:hypothetical protein